MCEESGCVKRKRGHLKGKKTYIYVTQSGMEMSTGRSHAKQNDGGWEKMGRGHMEDSSLQYTCTWGIMDIFFLRSWSPISVVCTPSIFRPPVGSANRYSRAISDDFPAPVLPTMPTCLAGL